MRELSARRFRQTQSLLEFADQRAVVVTPHVTVVAASIDL